MVGYYAIKPFYVAICSEYIIAKTGVVIMKFADHMNKNNFFHPEQNTKIKFRFSFI